MERTTEFNLSKAIAAWKETLMASGNFNKEQLEELESHLLDQIEALGDCSISQREAFLVAKDRIGHHDDLKASYTQSKSLWALFKLRSTLYLQALIILMSITLATQIASFTSTLVFNHYVLKHHTGPYLYIGILLISLTILFLYLRHTFRKSLNPENRISFTGYLTIGMTTLLVLSTGALLYMTKVTMPQEYFSIVQAKQYMRIAAFLFIILGCIGYSVYEFRLAKLKTSQA